MEQLQREADLPGDEMGAEFDEATTVPDDLAAMILLCCNPDLNPKAQVCLTLKSACGFLVRDPTLPEYEEPLMSPRSQPELAARYPLILTCAMHTLFCESQHRALPSLRRQALDPEVELHPADAVERGIRAGDWVSVETPAGSIRARARLNDSL